MGYSKWAGRFHNVRSATLGGVFSTNSSIGACERKKISVPLPCPRRACLGPLAESVRLHSPVASCMQFGMASGVAVLPWKGTRMSLVYGKPLTKAVALEPVEASLVDARNTVILVAAWLPHQTCGACSSGGK